VSLSSLASSVSVVAFSNLSFSTVEVATMVFIEDSLVLLGSGVVVTVVTGVVVVLVASVVSVAAGIVVSVIAGVEVSVAAGIVVSVIAGVVVSVAARVVVSVARIVLCSGVEFDPTEAVVGVGVLTGDANTVLDWVSSVSSSDETLYTGNPGHSPSQVANTVEVWGSAAVVETVVDKVVVVATVVVVVVVVVVDGA